MPIANTVLDLVGWTPMVRLRKLEKEWDAQAEVVAKLEYFNPGSSIKDRLASAMVEAAEAEGKKPHLWFFAKFEEPSQRPVNVK